MSDIKKAPVPSEPPPSYESSAEAPPSGTTTTSTTSTPSKPPILRAPLPFEHPTLLKLRGQRVILASASPRRRHLLAQVGLNNLEIIPSTAPEDFPKSLSPFEYVLETATQKAMTVYKQEIDNEAKGEPALVIAADTVVVSHVGEILEKPRSEKEHIGMLKTLRSEPSHRVCTAVAVMAPLEAAISPGYALETMVEETMVKFDNSISDAEILAYVKTREGADKAGGYGIQGIGSVLVERIEGSFDNVVGLPVRATIRLIEKVLDQPDVEDDEDEDLLGDAE